MSKLKIPALSFITLHLKKINSSLYKQSFSREQIPFKSLYSAACMLVLASVLVGSVFISVNKKEQNIAVIPQQDREEQVAAPAQVLLLEEKAALPHEVASAPLQMAKSQSSPEDSSRFLGVKGEIKVNFGWYLHPLYKDWRYHTGIDVLGIKGQTVSAIHSGQVTDIFQDPNSGLTVVVKYNNYQVHYGSLTKVTIGKGSFIQAGQEIGKMGSCDAEPYDHLHLAIKKNDDYIDPLLVMNKE